MHSSEQINKIHQVLQEVFPNDQIPDDIKNLVMGDLASWDSLGNFNLILAVETEFDVRFSMDEISEIKSVIEILEALDANGV
jgi:acyl carrier protein|tara:strand:- start:825 stop:1070 length:246 start_codon:yes stop_codon:yes gene_type:complete